MVFLFIILYRYLFICLFYKKNIYFIFEENVLVISKLYDRNLLIFLINLCLCVLRK